MRFRVKFTTAVSLQTAAPSNITNSLHLWHTIRKDIDLSSRRLVLFAFIITAMVNRHVFGFVWYLVFGTTITWLAFVF